MDAQVLEGELQAKLEILNGYYYLADVGYPLLNEILLTPYHGVRYHLAEWSRAHQSKEFYLVSSSGHTQGGAVQSLSCHSMQCD